MINIKLPIYSHKITFFSNLRNKRRRGLVILLLVFTFLLIFWAFLSKKDEVFKLVLPVFTGRKISQILRIKIPVGYIYKKNPFYYRDKKDFMEDVDRLITFYPRLATKIVIGESAQKNELFIVKVSSFKKTKNQKEQILLTSLIHANEEIGGMINFLLLDYLLRNYDSDEEVRQILDSKEIYFNIIYNPDGFDFYKFKGFSQRNNVVDRDFDGIISENEGFDLNRDFEEDRPQKETLAMRDFLEFLPHLVMAIDFHSLVGKGFIIYPLDSDYRNSEEKEKFRILGKKMKQLILSYKDMDISTLRMDIVNKDPFAGGSLISFLTKRGISAVAIEVPDCYEKEGDCIREKFEEVRPALMVSLKDVF